MEGHIDIIFPAPPAVFGIFLGIVVVFLIYWLVKLVGSIVTGG